MRVTEFQGALVGTLADSVVGAFVGALVRSAGIQGAFQTGGGGSRAGLVLALFVLFVPVLSFAQRIF